VSRRWTFVRRVDLLPNVGSQILRALVEISIPIPEGLRHEYALS